MRICKLQVITNIKPANMSKSYLIDYNFNVQNFLVGRRYRTDSVNINWCSLNYSKYSKTPIYRGLWGQAKTRGKSGSAVNRGFVWFTLCIFSLIWGKEMAAVYRGLR